MADLLVYAVGDSVMWGEGLAEENKFAFRAAASLAKARALKPNLKLLAHCGATIKQDFKKREAFVNKFPHLFRNEKEKTDFLAESGLRPDERPGERLHGEIARAFPTVPHQIRSISASQGSEIDVLLINGGANDLDFEEVFQTEDFLEELDDDYKRIFHDVVMDLLTLAREKCPKALIVLVGYYSAFSPDSRFGDIKDMFLELSKKESDYELYTFFKTMMGKPLAHLLEELTGVEDKIEDAISLARATSESGESRGLYWMRRVVSEINEDPSLAGIRGAGVVFASPGFLPNNCMFAPETFIWQRYEGTLDDDVAADRLKACPREALRNRMADLGFRLPKQEMISADTIVDLHNDLDGPEDLRKRLDELSKDIVNFNIREPVAGLLIDEVNRIDITRISSLFHPNRRGAARYTSVVHKRAEEYRETSVRDRILAFLPPAQRKSLPPFIEVRKTIRRYELNSVNPNESIIFDTRLGLKACLVHAEPDVVGIVIKTHPTSDIFSREVFLNLGEAGQWKLRHLLMEDLTGDGELNPHLKPGTRDFFTIDVSGQVFIGDITRLTIQFDRDLPEGDSWRPLEIVLSIDGRDVCRRKFDVAAEVTESISLEYPRSEHESD